MEQPRTGKGVDKIKKYKASPLPYLGFLLNGDSVTTWAKSQFTDFPRFVEKLILTLRLGSQQLALV